MQPIQPNQCNHISLKGETKGMKTCRYKVHKDGLCETHYNIKERHDKRDKEIPRVDVLSKVECFDKEIADKLLKSVAFHSDDEATQKQLEIVKAQFNKYIKKSKLEGNTYMTTVNYDRRTYGRFNNRVGRNDAFVLRWSCTNMPGWLRNILFYNHYWDLDFSGCHNSITDGVFKHYNLERKYTSLVADKDGREEILTSLSQNTGLSRKACKTLILRIFYGGNYKAWFDDNKISLMTISTEDIAHLENLQAEVHTNITTLLNGELKHYLDFTRRVKASELEHKEQFYRDIYSIAWAYFCQDIERRAIEHLIVAVEKCDIQVAGIIHDGFHMEKKFSVEHMRDVFFTEWEEAVKQGLKDDIGIDIDLKVEVKPMTPNFDKLVEYKEQEEEIPEAKTYEGVKFLFEKNNFFLTREGRYCSVFEDGEFVLQNKTTFKDRFENMKYEEKIYNEKKEKYEVKKASFIDRWFKDEDKMSYTQAKVYPPPMKCPTGEYNLWTGFKAQQTKYPEGKSADDYKEEVEYILNHLKYLGGNGWEYLLKTQALYSQKPGFKQGVMTTYKSDAEGIGKSTMLNLNTAWMGERWTVKIDNPDTSLLGNFNSVIENKVYVFLEEFDGSNSKGQAGRLLMEFITSTVDNINKKQVNQYTVKSFTHFEGSTNSLVPKKISDKNRRDVFYEIKGNPKSKEYFDKLYSIIDNEHAMKAWYEYLLTIDIDNVNWIKDRPDTEMMQDIQEASEDLLKGWLLKWIDDLIYNRREEQTCEDYDVKFSVKDVYDFFTMYIESSRIKYDVNITSFGLRLKKFKLDCWEHVKPKNVSTYKFSLIDCIKELHTKGIYTTEDITTYSEWFQSQIMTN